MKVFYEHVAFCERADGHDTIKLHMHPEDSQPGTQEIMEIFRHCNENDILHFEFKSKVDKFGAKPKILDCHLYVLDNELNLFKCKMDKEMKFKIERRVDVSDFPSLKPYKNAKMAFN